MVRSGARGRVAERPPRRGGGRAGAIVAGEIRLDDVRLDGVRFSFAPEAERAERVAGYRAEMAALRAEHLGGKRGPAIKGRLSAGME